MFNGCLLFVNVYVFLGGCLGMTVVCIMIVKKVVKYCSTK